MDGEGNLCSFFSGGQLFAIAAILLLKDFEIETLSERLPLLKITAGFSFLYLAVDEVMALHEKLSVVIHKSFISSIIPINYCEWVFVYLISGSILLFVFYNDIMFLLKSFKKEVLLGIFGVIVLLSGALGVEILSYILPIRNEALSHIFRISVAVEEFLEMFGVTLILISTIKLSFIQNHDK